MRSYRIGSVFGIPIEVDFSLLLVLPVLGWVIGSQVTRWVSLLNQLPNGGGFAGTGLTTGVTPWLLGIAAAVGLFVGVLLHELGHSVVAIHYGYEIESIKLWIFGGVAQFLEMPEQPRQEVAVSIAGPLVSVVLGVFSYIGFRIVSPVSPVLTFVFGYLTLMNISLTVFNLLPAFPMDGGRVLRAWLARNQPFAEATRTAARVGKVFAILLGLIGLLGFNLLLIGIAFFIYIGAEGEARQAEMKATFEGVTVGDLMTPVVDLQTVRPETPISELVTRMLRERHTGYPVVSNDGLVGIVTLDDLQHIPEAERDAYRVKDLMTSDLETIHIDDNPIDALQRMQQTGIGRLPVVDDTGAMVGLISRTDLMKAFTISSVGSLLDDLRQPRLRSAETSSTGFTR
ncbi:MAG: CBS domain-containing protein [Halobacteriales archaeon]|nr:CBS domain-containing protein [Halobacteriales archaeon]